MKKEDILEKARAEKSDEMETFIQDKSMIWVMLAMFVCLCVFSFTKFQRELPTEDYSATFGIAVSVGNIYRFIKTKKRGYLISGIIFGAVGILWTVIYFCKYLGV